MLTGLRYHNGQKVEKELSGRHVINSIVHKYLCMLPFNSRSLISELRSNSPKTHV